MRFGLGGGGGGKGGNKTKGSILLIIGVARFVLGLCMVVGLLAVSQIIIIIGVGFIRNHCVRIVF
jgi:dipeptide/tripeptide permease